MKKASKIQEILDIVLFLKDHAATKEELFELKEEIGEVRSELKAEIVEVRSELKAEIGEVRTELKAEISGVRTELKAEISGVRTELKNEINKVRNEMIDHVDGFIGLHRKTDLECAALGSKCRRLERRQDAIIQHVGVSIA